MDKKNIADNSSQKPNVNWKSLLWTIALLLILNSLVFPYLFKQNHSDNIQRFISKVDSGLVKQVNIDGNKVYFTTPNGEVDRKGNPIDAIFKQAE